MRTLFTREPWRPMMGRDDSWMDPAGEASDLPPKPTDWSWLNPLTTGIKDIYTGWQAGQTAEEIKKAEEAKLAAERARIEAERLRLQQQAAGPTQAVLGVPRDYVIVGGIGLAVIATIAILT